MQHAPGWDISAYSHALDNFLYFSGHKLLYFLITADGVPLPKCAKLCTCFLLPRNISHISQTSNPNILELHRRGAKFSSSRAVPLGVQVLTAEWVKGIQVAVSIFHIMTTDLTQRPSKDTTVISVGQKLHSEIQNTS